MAELKPCPFCGGRPHFEDYGKYGGWSVRHTCKGGKGDDQRLWINACGLDSLGAAVKVWNRRADAAQGTNALTNEDRIHSARGRELAQILYSIDGVDYCKELPECGKLLFEEDGIPEERCISCIENWLKKPVKEDNK